MKVIILALISPLFFAAISCSTANDYVDQPEATIIPKANEAASQSIGNESSIGAMGGLISLEAKRLDSDHGSTLSCDLDEPSNAHRCSLVQNNNLLIADDQQIRARGDSRCLAKSALEADLFKQKILLNGGIIECHPDATPIAECSIQPKNCESSPEIATRCFAKEIEANESAWTNRPEAWGKSECEARSNLHISACNKGLTPSEMKSIVCEKEVSPVVCPPTQQNCLVQGNELIECRIGKVGDTPLREALKGFGSTTCEASYRVKDLACRWQRKPINDLNEVECRSITKGESFPPSTAKIVKKVKILKL